uniref:Uncharacterized protein n=1 Tax=Panagrolaimus sp. PS1159 TaxID=55785 RepID=A0AC35GVX2_9BILA
MVQTATLFTFGLPCLIWLGTLLLPEMPTQINSISLYLEALATMYPIFDVIVVISISLFSAQKANLLIMDSDNRDAKDSRKDPHKQEGEVTATGAEKGPRMDSEATDSNN